MDGKFQRNATGPAVPDIRAGFDLLLFNHHNGGILGGEGAFLDRLFFTVLPGLNNDGIEDFEFSAVVASNGNNLDGITIDQQGVKAVEVQPVPEASSFLLIGFPLLLAFSLRNRIPNLPIPLTKNMVDLASLISGFWPLRSPHQTIDPIFRTCTFFGDLA